MNAKPCCESEAPCQALNARQQDDRALWHASTGANTGGDTHVSTMYDVGDDIDAWPVEIVLAGSAIDLYHDAMGGPYRPTTFF